MIIAILLVFGLCLGSFVNALVWRLREQEILAEAPVKHRKKAQKNKLDLSIMHGRSMCTHCHHQLHAQDLVPVLSWLSLGGKCRYCQKPISPQYPVVELLTMLLFVASYAFWPKQIQGAEIVLFSLWLLLLVGFMALIVYDLKWYLLPNRIVFPLGAIAVALVLTRIIASPEPLQVFIQALGGLAVGGGIFYVLFQVSQGKWIGGGDVKLGWVLGLVVGSPSKAFLLIFLAALGGSLVALPLIATKRLKPDTVIPFGPFLIIAAVFVMLFGNAILEWYGKVLLVS